MRAFRPSGRESPTERSPAPGIQFPANSADNTMGKTLSHIDLPAPRNSRGEEVCRHRHRFAPPAQAASRSTPIPERRP
jgi:hypothetical protein